MYLQELITAGSYSYCIRNVSNSEFESWHKLNLKIVIFHHCSKRELKISEICTEYRWKFTHTKEYLSR